MAGRLERIAGQPEIYLDGAIILQVRAKSPYSGNAFAWAEHLPRLCALRDKAVDEIADCFSPTLRR